MDSAGRMYEEMPDLPDVGTNPRLTANIPHQDQAQPEGGQRLTGQRQYFADIVEYRVLFDCRQHTHWHRDESCYDQRKSGQLRRSRQAVEDQVDSLLVPVLDGLAEIAGQGIAQELEVLDVDRLVQSPRGTDTRRVFNRGFQGQQHVQRVPGEASQAEHNHRQHKQGQDGLDDPYQDIALHN